MAARRRETEPRAARRAARFTASAWAARRSTLITTRQNVGGELKVYTTRERPRCGRVAAKQGRRRAEGAPAGERAKGATSAGEPCPSPEKRQALPPGGMGERRRSSQQSAPSPRDARRVAMYARRRGVRPAFKAETAERSMAEPASEVPMTLESVELSRKNRVTAEARAFASAGSSRVARNAEPKSQGPKRSRGGLEPRGHSRRRAKVVLSRTLWARSRIDCHAVEVRRRTGSRVAR